MQLISQRRPGLFRLLSEWAQKGLITGLLALMIALATVRVAPVRGASMEPTLHDGQLLWYQSLPNLLLSLEHGEIVVFDSPVAPGHRYVKRLVGLPGDELRFRDGCLRINGIELTLPRGAIEPGFELSTRVPTGSFFAIGDHGAVSYDSRRFGSVPLSSLVGRVISESRDRKADQPPQDSLPTALLARDRAAAARSRP